MEGERRWSHAPLVGRLNQEQRANLLSWLPWLGLALPMVVLLLLALREIGATSFWRDEVASVVFAKSSVRELVTLFGRDREKVGLANMAFYYLVLHFWLLVGETEARVRLLSVVFGVMAVVPVFMVTRRIAGALGATLAAAAFALMPQVIHYSQEARGYSLAMLIAGALTWLVIIGVERGRRAWWPWLAYGVVAAIGLYVHFFVALVIAAHGLWILVTRQLPGWRGVLAGLIPMVAALVPIPSIIAQYGGGHGWIGDVSMDKLMSAFTGLLGGLALLLAVGALGAAAVIGRRRDRRIWLVAAAAALPIILTVLVSVWKPLLVSRYLVVSLPAVAMLMGCGLVVLRGYWRVAAVAIVAIVMLAALPRAYVDTRQQDWRSAARWIAGDAAQGDRIGYRGFGRRPIEYYLDRYRSGPLPRPMGLSRAAVGRPAQRLWVVFAGNYGGAPPIAPGLLDAYRVVEQRQFNAKVVVVLLEGMDGVATP